MNKKENKRIVTSYNYGKVPEKLIVEMLLHSIVSPSIGLDGLSASFEDAVQRAALRIDEFYKTKVLTCKNL